jgi:hypothetical protein
MQNALTAAVDKAMRLLDDLDRESTEEQAVSSFANRLEALAADLPRMSSELSQENCKYFGKDEELFGLEQKAEHSPASANLALSNPPALTQDDGAKARIVVVRTSASAATPIPLAEGTQDTAA